MIAPNGEMIDVTFSQLYLDEMDLGREIRATMQLVYATLDDILICKNDTGTDWLSSGCNMAFPAWVNLSCCKSTHSSSHRLRRPFVR